MSIDSLEDTSIFKSVLKDRQDITGRVKSLFGKYKKVGGGVFQDFPDYPDHFVGHILGVIENTFRIFGGPEQIDTILEPHEIEMLLKATILHDSGKIRTKKDPDELTREEIRARHHLRSRGFVTDSYEDLGLSKDEARYIGEIVAAHRIEYPISDVSESEPIGHEKYKLRLLAGILRVADELHLTADRTDELIKTVYGIKPDNEIYHRLHKDNVGILRDDKKEEISVKYKVTFTEEIPFYEELSVKVREVFDSVKDVFEVNDVPLKSISLVFSPEPDLEENELKVKKTVLNNSLSLKEVAATTDIHESTIEEIMSGLKVVGKLVEVKGRYEFNKDFGTFTSLAKDFLGKKDFEFEFLNSKYTREDIKRVLEVNLCTKFGFDQNEPGDFVDKLLISPTALKWILFDERVEKGDLTLNPESKKGQFYTILLAGFSTDIIYYPEILNEENLSYFNDVANEMRRHLSGFFLIIKEYNNILPSHINAPEKDGIKGKVNITFPVLKDGPVLDISKLFAASQKTKQPLLAKVTKVAFSGNDDFDELEETEDTQVFARFGPSGIKLPILPRRMFCTFKARGLNEDELQLWIRKEYTKECYYQDYLILQLAAKENGNADINISFPDYVDVGYYLEQMTLLKGVSHGRYKYISIIDSIDNATLDFGPIERIGLSNLTSLIDPAFWTVVTKLDEIPHRSKIILPKFLTNEQAQYLTENRGERYSRKRLSRIKFDGYITMPRLLYGSYDTGISDIETLPFATAKILLTDTNRQSSRDTAELYDFYADTYQEKPEAISYRYLLPQDAITVFNKLSSSKALPGLIKSLRKVIKSKSKRKRKSELFVIIYPPADMFWFNGQAVDFCCVQLKGIWYYLSNADYYLNVTLDYKKALRYLNKAEEYEPDSFSIAGNKGWAYLALGRFDKGFHYLSKAERVDIEKEGDTYLFNLGLYYLLLNDKEKGWNYYRKALEKQTWRILVPLAIEDIENFIKKGYVGAENAEFILKKLRQIDSGNVGRNDYCPCGSGKKYKNCHYRKIRKQ